MSGAHTVFNRVSFVLLIWLLALGVVLLSISVDLGGEIAGFSVFLVSGLFEPASSRETTPDDLPTPDDRLTRRRPRVVWLRRLVPSLFLGGACRR